MVWDAHILAGGQARRFGGRDKSALVVGARPILDRQIAMLRGRAARIVIVGGPAGRPAPAGTTVIADRLPGTGALGALYTALDDAMSARTLVLACDMPFVTGEFVEYLARTGLDCDVALPRTGDGLHPLCAMYARDAAPVIRRSIDQGERRVREAVAMLRLRVIEGRELAAFDRDGRLLHNINTQDDYDRARAMRG
jgi:molybdopterin-guanine dinucleotide biosynthesis protein A